MGDEVLKVLSKAMSAPVLRFVESNGPVRNQAIAAHVDGSPSTLSDRLGELADIGAITRKQFDEIPPRVEYDVTPGGRELRRLLDRLADWDPDAVAVAADGGIIEDVSERLEVREVYCCAECDDFELEKTFSGVAGTTGHEQYDCIDAPGQCPVCGGEIEHEVNP